MRLLSLVAFCSIAELDLTRREQRENLLGANVSQYPSLFFTK